MSIAKKLLAFSLCFSLIGTAIPVNAYAEDYTDDVALQEIVTEVSEENTDVMTDDTLMEESMEAEQGEPVEEVTTEAADASDISLEYLYVGEETLGIDDEQEVMVSLEETGVTVTNAKLHYVVGNTDTEETEPAETQEKTAEVTTIEGQTLLFMVQHREDFAEGDQITLTGLEVVYTKGEAEEEYTAQINLDDLEILAQYTLTEEEVAETTVTLEEAEEMEAVQETSPTEEAEVAAAAVLTEEELSTETETVETSVYTDADVDETAEVATLSEALELVEETAQNGTTPKVVVMLDPGHDDTHSGACCEDVREEKLNLAVAKYCKAELETYAGVTVLMTRTTGACPEGGGANCLTARLNKACTTLNKYKAQGAKVIYVSIHMNASDKSYVKGVSIYVPNSNYNKTVYKEGTALGNKILNQLTSLGLIVFSTGLVHDDNDGNTYPDGSDQDDLAVNRICKLNGITGIIVEHAFLSNSSDRSKLTTTSFQKKLGIADATGIAEYYGLSKGSKLSTGYHVTYSGHVQTIGWQDYVYDGESAGTSGRSLRVEAMKIKVINVTEQNGKNVEEDVTGAITYQTHIQGIGWQNWVKDGALTGTSGQSKRLEAIKIKLTGDLATKYDVYYRVHAQKYGWLGWAKNGESAGTAGYSLRLEAVQIVLVKKGEAAPGETKYHFRSATNVGTLTYQAHVQNYGWMNPVADGDTAGTQGESKRIEAFRIWLNDPTDASGNVLSGSITYRTQVQTYGWLDWVSEGEDAGTSGESKRMETIQIKLTGDVANYYDIYYRTHCQSYGTLGWAKNGESAGTVGYSKRMEFVEIKLVAKSDTATANELLADGKDACITFQYPITVTVGATQSGQEMYNYFLNCGLTKQGVAGLMGNLYAESALVSNNLQNSYNNSLKMTDKEYTAAVDNGSYTNFVHDSAGYGLAQWTYWSRKEKLWNYKVKKQTSIGNSKMQCGYLMTELSNYMVTDPKTKETMTLLQFLKTTTSIADASKIVLQEFEKPASYKELSTINLRKEYSQKMYDMYANN